MSDYVWPCTTGVIGCQKDKFSFGWPSEAFQTAFDQKRTDPYNSKRYSVHFGEGTFLEKHGMIDGCFTSRLEVKTKIITLTKVLLKKAEAQVKNESNVKINQSLQSAS